MKRVRTEDLNTPEYYDTLWLKKVQNGTGWFDKERHRALCRDILPEHDVADVGCGLWGPLEWLLTDHPERWPARTVFCDFSDFVRARLERQFPLAEFADSVDALPPCDVAISGEVIEHVQDPMAFAARLAKSAKHSIALSTLDHECRQAKEHGEYPEHLWEFSAAGLKSVLSPVCRRVEYVLVGNYHVVWGYV